MKGKRLMKRIIATQLAAAMALTLSPVIGSEKR